jgi:hypothetical protein
MRLVVIRRCLRSKSALFEWHITPCQRQRKRFRSRSINHYYGFPAHWSSLSFWNNSNQRLKKLDMTFKYRNVNVISIILKNTDIPIYRKLNYNFQIFNWFCCFVLKYMRLFLRNGPLVKYGKTKFLLSSSKQFL